MGLYAKVIRYIYIFNDSLLCVLYLVKICNSCCQCIFKETAEDDFIRVLKIGESKRAHVLYLFYVTFLFVPGHVSTKMEGPHLFTIPKKGLRSIRQSLDYVASRMGRHLGPTVLCLMGVPPLS